MTTDPAADGAATATARGPAVVLTGGPHPFAATTPQVVELLAEVGLAATVTPDPDRAAVLLAGAGSDDPDDRDDPGTRAAPRLLVLNTLRWRMGADRYASQREAHAYATSPAWRDAVTAHLAAGGALLALHAAPICFDDWPGWRDVVGAAWRWDVSSHPPLGPVRVHVCGSHPIVDGIDDFTVHDEAYGFMDLAGDVVPLATARHGGADHPLLWARRVATGRVVTSTLGHGPESFAHPVHRELLRRALGWLLDRGPAPATS